MKEALLVDNSNDDYINALLKDANNSRENVNLEMTNVIYHGLEKLKCR